MPGVTLKRMTLAKSKRVQLAQAEASCVLLRRDTPVCDGPPGPDGLCPHHRAVLAGIGTRTGSSTRDRLDPIGSERRRAAAEAQQRAALLAALGAGLQAVHDDRRAAYAAQDKRTRAKLWWRNSYDRHREKRRAASRARHAEYAALRSLEMRLRRAEDVQRTRADNHLVDALQRLRSHRAGTPPKRLVTRTRPCPRCPGTMTYTQRPPQMCDACWAREAETLRAQVDAARAAVGLGPWAEREAKGYRGGGVKRRPLPPTQAPSRTDAAQPTQRTA